MSINAGQAVAYLTLDRSGYSRGLISAYQDLNTFIDRTNSADTRINALGNSMIGVGSTMTKGITIPLVGAGTAIATVSANFQEGMSEVQAISGATGKDFEKLTDKAKELGAKTKYSATEASQGMANLASAGFNVNEIISAMPGMLDLAASGNIDLASAADIASSTLRGFGLEASQATHVADVLARAAADTNAGITDTGEAMKYIAPVAASMGFSLEEVTAAIGEMANAGIKGGQAGTTLRSALTRLANPSKEAADLMKELSFNCYDTNGKMIPLKDIISNLSGSMEGLTEEQQQQAIATIFGQEAMSGMLTLIQAGPEELEKLTNSLIESDGASKSMAETMQNNLKGALTKIKSALEGAAISLGETLIPMLSNLAEKIQGAVDWFNNLDSATKESIVKFGLYAAAAGPAILVTGKLVKTGAGAITMFGRLATKIGGLTGDVAALGSTAGVTATGGIAKVGTGLAELGPAAGIAGIAIAGVGAAIYTAHEYNDLYSSSILKATDDMSLMEKGLGKLTGATIYSKEELQKHGYIYKDWSENVSEATQEALDTVAEKSREIQLAIDSVNFDGVITEEDVIRVKSKTEDWCKSIIEVINGNKTEVNTAIEELFNADGIITDGEQEVIDIMNANSDGKVKIVQDCEEQINQITKTAYEENRAINEEELANIKEIRKRANDAYLDSLMLSKEDEMAIEEEFVYRANAFSSESLSKSLTQEKAAMEQSKQSIKDTYDSKIETLKREASRYSGEQKEKMDKQIELSERERDVLIENEDRKWLGIIGACEQGYSDYMITIDKYTGKVLSRREVENQQLFKQELSKYEGLNRITEDGLYEIYNKDTHHFENLQVKVDETSGEIVAMAKYTQDEYGISHEKIMGYGDEYIKSLQKQVGETVATKARMVIATRELCNSTVNSNGEIINSNGEVIGSLQEVEKENGILKGGIIELNGTPINVKVDKDGAITNIDEIVRKLAMIKDKHINVTTTFVTGGGANKIIHSKYATGTEAAMKGMALVGEHGPELVSMQGGEKVYNAIESRKIINSMNTEKSSSFDNNILSNVLNELEDVSSKLNKVLNDEGTLQMNSDIIIDKESVGRILTPIVSNKLAIASIKRRG